MSNVANKEIMIVDENSIKDKIYLIRGQKVMLDFNLAEIYGYETKRFNEQVKNIINRFPPELCFKLTAEEYVSLARSKKSTARIWTVGNSGGRASLTYAFTKQGIYHNVKEDPTAVLN